MDGGQLGIDLRVTQSFSAYRTVAELFEIGLDDIPFVWLQMENRVGFDIDITLGGPHLLWVVKIEERIGNQ